MPQGVRQMSGDRAVLTRGLRFEVVREEQAAGARMREIVLR